MTALLVPGHSLRSEGTPYTDPSSTCCPTDPENRLPSRIGWRGTGGPGHAVCSCGAVSPHLTSSTQRKAWHRQHKAEVLQP